MRSFLPFVFLMLVAGLCAPASADDPIRIGVSLGLSGRYALPAEMHQRSYELCQAEANDAGDVLDRPLAFIIEDDRGEVAEVARIYKSFTAGRADIIIAPYGSDLTSVASDIAEEGNYPMLAPGAAADGLWRRGYRNIIGVITPASRYTVGILGLASEHRMKRIALVHAGDAFSQEIAEGARKWAPFLKFNRFVLDEELSADARDDPRMIARIRAARAEVLVVAGYSGEAVRMRRALAEAGWMPPIFFATVGPSLPAWLTELGPLGDKAFTTSIWEPPAERQNSASQEFSDAFAKRFGVAPSYHAAAAYAACQIMIMALRKAGSLDRDRYRETLFGMDVMTIIGRFLPDRSGMQTKRDDLVVQWIDGRKEIVWPDERRTAEPVFGGAQQ
ncbi:MAG: amino acid ABC transporter substrate-binding protein [Aestuariivirga sp.]